VIPETRQESEIKMMANDPFNTVPVYPNKQKGPQAPIPTRRG
jgi:hypothetical protein